MMDQLPKRLLSFVLAMVMVFSTIPVQGFADEVDDHSEETTVVTETILETEASQPAATETQAAETVPAATDAADETQAPAATEEQTEDIPEASTEAEETTVPSQPEDQERVRAIQARIDALLDAFGITAGMGEEAIEWAILNADEVTVKYALEESAALEQEGAALTEAEFAQLTNLEPLSEFLSLLNAIYTTSTLASKTVTVLDGQVSITDDQGTGKVSEGVVTITVKGSLFSTKTNTITVTNATDNKAQLSFTYGANNANSFTIAGSSGNTSGSYTVVLEAKQTVTIKLTAGGGYSTATLTLSNFALVAAADESQVTFAYDAAGGSITVGGENVAVGGSKKISLTDGAELVATAKTGYTFLGWIDEEHLILSEEATYTLKPAEDMTVTAVFAKDGGEGWFAVGAAAQKYEEIGLLNLTKRYYYTVGHTYLYNDLNAAAEAAASGTEKTLVLMNNATLPAGNYTIPAGVTLLIPFDGVNTLYTTEAVSVSTNNYKTPTAYRTLTMASGANLMVNGALSLSAQHTYAYGSRYYGGTPTGNVSFVKMEGNSNITVNNGGALYAYGYVTGSGTVTANSGAKVYELFQFTDFRGGTASTSMENGVFPLSQYYIQNIEVPMTIYSGATEYAYTSVYMSSTTFGSAVGFIAASDAMFNLSNGYVVKRYDGATDRLIVEGHGDLKLSSIKMSIGNTSINSKNYELPINSNITVSIQSGTINVNQDVALQPGSRVEIAEGARCVLGSGVSLYVYDADEWGTFCGSVKEKLIPLVYAPGRTYNRTVADLVDAKVVVNGTVDASAGYLYTTNGGADICGTGTIKTQPGTQTVTYQSHADGAYTEIAITPAQLHNADGSYTQTTKAGEYTCTNGTWSKICKHTNQETVTGYAATCEKTGLTDGVKCSDCGEWITQQQEISKLNHDWADATCTEPKTCKTCKTTEGEALGHDWADATCTTPKTCKTCKATEGEAKGHDWADATCTAPKTCKTCKATEGTAKGHAYNDVVTSPSCTEDGYTTHTCTACGDTYTDSKVTAPGHNRGDNAQCSEEAECTVCGKKLPANAEHQYKDEVTAPTCTEQGYTTHTCLNCGHSYVDSYVVKNGHSYKHEVTDPTCTEKGYTTHTCTSCGDTYVDTYEDPSGHSHVPTVTDPTCTEKGYTTYTCHCGDTYVSDYVDAKGHTPSNEAKCAEDVECTVCHAPIAPTADHDYNVETVAPTCTENGYTRHTCKNCGKTFDDNIVTALNHDLIFEEEFPATCTDDGHSAGSYCSRCDYVTWEVYKAPGHDMQDVEAKIPTYTNVGWNAHKKCSKCSYKEGYEELAKLPEPVIDSYEEFLENLPLLEELAQNYVLENPGKDPLNLVIKYIRTGVDRYNSGSWGIMAGYEDTGFAKYVSEKVDEVNSTAVSTEELLKVTGLKNIEEFTLPNGDTVDFGHMFGTMDITYHNNGSQNHADVAGWGGDITDLLSAADRHNVTGTLEEMVTEIRNDILCKDFENEDDLFSQTDMFGDLDGLYLMNTLGNTGYASGTLTTIMEGYFTNSLSMKSRADYFLRNRLDGATLRSEIRNAVYNAYTGNKVIATLEGTRDFTSENLAELRKACCYAFADYICQLAGDYVDQVENTYYEVFDTKTSTLAPGVTQQIKYATTADNKQMAYYIATADITRSDVQVFANYNNNDPASGWAMQRVLDQANAAQKKYGDENSENYIENYNVIASINASGYNMSTGEPSGLLVMGGVQYHAPSSSGFFGILKDGTAVVGTTEEYNTIYKDQVQEGVEIFGTTLIKNGKIAVNASSDYYTSRASRTAVGITATGKVVMMVLDGRQEPFSCGGSMQEIAQIMFEAGCVEAVNLDGGGSTTYVARQAGDEELSVVNRPSDGAARSVSSTLMIVSTAPSSTAFDHAVVKADYDYMTVGTTVQMNATGISATGAVAEIPEGATWAVDGSCATISEDGVLTANALGSVTVQLKVDGQVVGTKTMNVVQPDNVYFTKNSINAVYGQSVQLPVKALYQGKEVAIRATDLQFSCNSAVGTVEGFYFTAKMDASVKNTKVTATLTCDSSVSASITVALYNQGEVSFDFEQAVGGDRQMAWDRVVSNATTSDNASYEVIDTEKDMVTDYTFAIDMSQIPIPEQLSDLIYMLPGADAENASAWGFLMQLAERVSVLTEVKPVIRFDANMDVDYSNLKLVNDYFQLNATEFNEETNELTLTLNWIKQTAAIDPESANPLCILSGIKLTPKEDAAWDSTSSLNVSNTGTISYKIYLRASGLYSFAQKEENQKIYGLLPYVNPNNDTDKGGWFGSVYCTFSDSYTLINALKEGWVNEIGGYAYYVNGQRLTGIQKVDDFYYDFGEDGINAGQTKYNGVFFDEDAKVYRYAYLGQLASGWQLIDNEWYYFESSTMAAAQGSLTVNHVPYEFEENGKLVSGVWMNVFVGYRYYYGPDYVRSGWYQIGEDWYYFKNAFAVTGDARVNSIENVTQKCWYHFDENGACQGELTGIVEYNGKLYYIENGKPTEKGLFKYNGYHYCAQYDGSLIVNQRYYVWLLDSTAELPKGHYDFDVDGRLLGANTDTDGGVSGIVEKDGKLYYYENGKPTEKGLFKYNGYYYVAQYDGTLIVNQKYYVWLRDSTADLPNGHYEFGADGKMLQGIVDKDGVLYYYENGQSAEKGLFKYDGDYYFAQYDGKLIVNQNYYVYKLDSTVELPKDHYEFGADGKMLQGIVNKDGALYYYENGKPIEKGLFVYDGDHYFSQYDGKLVTSQKYYAWKVDESAQLPKGTYEFAADGKVIGTCLTGEIVDKDGVLYYYENAKPTEKGLFKFNGDYYVAQYDGKLIVNQKYYVWKTDSTADLPYGHYEFGADGKMLQGIVDKNGVLYYYENGNPTEKGLFKFNGDYYVAQYDGKLIVSQKYYVWKTDSTADLPNGHYEFGADGKMLQGIVDKDGVLYYYENGQPVEKGLFCLDGYYYNSRYDGSLVVDQKYYVWKTDNTADLPNGHYYFDENGRLTGGSKDGEIVSINGVLYYYEAGKPVEKGLFIKDGYYYFSQYDGKLIVDQEYYVWMHNGLLYPKHYVFNEQGQIVK